MTVGLIGTEEIRVRLGGVSRQRVHQIAARADFPRAVAVLAQGRVWLASEVDEWMKEHRPDAT